MSDRNKRTTDSNNQPPKLDIKRIADKLRPASTDGAGTGASPGSAQTASKPISGLTEQVGNLGSPEQGSTKPGSNTEPTTQHSSDGDPSGTDGSGRGREQGNNGSNSRTGTTARTGSGNRSRTGNAKTNNAQVGEMDSGRIDPVEIPKKTVPSRSKKPTNKADEKIQQAAIIGLISVGLNALYGTVALAYGEHWALQPTESQLLATQLNRCLETLPAGTYQDVTKYIEKYLPWVALAVTAGAITVPRIEQSRVKRETKPIARNSQASTPRVEQDQHPANPFEYGGKFNNPSNPVS